MGGNAIDHYFGKETDLKPTLRQLEILALAREGYSNRRIGQTLHIAEVTVKNYMSEAIIRLGASNRASAVINAIRQGYLGLYGPNIKRDKDIDINPMPR
jgi:DNA-binding NarL/FixJ family response regulator